MTKIRQNLTIAVTKLFQAAEIANFTKEEREAYEESLKHYRDIKM